MGLVVPETLRAIKPHHHDTSEISSLTWLIFVKKYVLIIHNM